MLRVLLTETVMEKRTDNTKFIILRFDNYISQANVKGNFLLAFNTFMIGGIVTNCEKILKLVDGNINKIIVASILSLLFIASLLTAYFVIKAVYPFLKSNNSSKDSYHSHIFFNSVCEFKDSDEYSRSLSSLTDERFDNDLAIQAYTLSKGLKSKYDFLGIAMKIIFVELILIASILIFIVL